MTAATMDIATKIIAMETIITTVTTAITVVTVAMAGAAEDAAGDN